MNTTIPVYNQLYSIFIHKDESLMIQVKAREDMSSSIIPHMDMLDIVEERLNEKYHKTR